MAQNICRQCGQTTSPADPTCQHCGAEIRGTTFETVNNTKIESVLVGPTLIASSGALILALGVFMPFVQMPLLGSVSYFMDGEINGWILLAIAGAVLVCSLLGKYRPAGLFGIAAGGYIGWDIYDVMNIQSYIDAEMKNDPMQGLVREMASSLQFEYGVAVLIVGALTIFIGATWGNHIIDHKKKQMALAEQPPTI